MRCKNSSGAVLPRVKIGWRHQKSCGLRIQMEGADIPNGVYQEVKTFRVAFRNANFLRLIPVILFLLHFYKQIVRKIQMSLNLSVKCYQMQSFDWNLVFLLNEGEDEAERKFDCMIFGVKCLNSARKDINDILWNDIIWTWYQSKPIIDISRLF